MRCCRCAISTASMYTAFRCSSISPFTFSESFNLMTLVVLQILYILPCYNLDEYTAFWFGSTSPSTLSDCLTFIHLVSCEIWQIRRFDVLDAYRVCSFTSVSLPTAIFESFIWTSSGAPGVLQIRPLKTLDTHSIFWLLQFNIPESFSIILLSVLEILHKPSFPL